MASPMVDGMPHLLGLPSASDYIVSSYFDEPHSPIPVDYCAVPALMSSPAASTSTLSCDDAQPKPFPQELPDEVAPLEQEYILSVSTAFFPGAHDTPFDTMFSSSDGVIFYVHSSVLTRTSKCAFEPLLLVSLTSDLCRNVCISVPEPSTVLNIMLHLLYGLSCAQNQPTFADIETAFDRLPQYGIDPRVHVTFADPFHELLLSFAPLFPLELYALAARHGLEDIAAAASTHLLSYNLADISDETAERIGAKYLKRLVRLHFLRLRSLRDILFNPPESHPPVLECSFSEQKKLTRAWALVTAYLAWDAKPDTSTFTIRSVFKPMQQQLSCDLCKKALEQRVKDVIIQWTNVDRKI